MAYEYKLNLNVGDKIRGWTVTRIRDVEETGGRLVEMSHDETGAGLCWVDNGEENKLFSVTFKTLPEDNTGVFHILEHSVLCGSDRYPVKEPFVELLKSSMNTFLNAMTYPDKTMYPVSSRVEQDYLNLAGVYLDAVFRPSILTNPNIFRQEGQHIELNDDGGLYKGVVFNEMKGAMSDVDTLAERELGKLLFPDNCYGFNSGGDPASITDLTYEKYIAMYKRYYHPSNAYFFLDGDVPLDKTLEMIAEYLDGAGKLTDLPYIPPQEPHVVSDSIPYEASGDDAKDLICFGQIVGTYEDRAKVLALDVLFDYLTDNNEAPLKRAVLSSGLAEDMELYMSDGIAQPYIVMMFRGTNADAADALLGIVRDTVRKVLDEGIPADALTAAVNQLDFRARQLPEPQGLYRAASALASWLYGGDPVTYIESNAAVAELRGYIASGGAEKLAEEFLADTSGYSRLTLTPSTSLGDEQRAAEEAKLQAVLGEMDDAAMETLRRENEELLDWQQTPDSEEALSAIPLLDLADVNAEPEIFETEEKERGDLRKLIFHPVQTNGVVYLTAYFPLTDLSLDELTEVSLIPELWKELPTENYDVNSLQREIKMYVGSLSFDIDILSRDDDMSSCTPCLRARAAVLTHNLEHAEDLIAEIMLRTKFDDTGLIRDLVNQIDEDGKRLAVSSGNRLAASVARAQFSARSAAGEAMTAYTFIQFLHKLNTGFDELIGSYLDKNLRLVLGAVSKQNAIVSVTATEYSDVPRLAELLPDGEARPESAVYTTALPAKMGIAVPASVSHAVQAYNLHELGADVRGSLLVTANMVSLSYLWNEIRVKGGAYGASLSANRTGGLLCYSYRDPDPAHSLEVYSHNSDFIRQFSAAAGNPELSGGLDGFIISTIAQSDPLLTPGSKGKIADDFYFSGYTDEERTRVRREMLETKPEDLTTWCDAVDALSSKGSICIVGPESALNKVKQSVPELEIRKI